MLLQYINKCLCWGRSMWAQWLNSNSLFWSAPERLEDLRHLRANYEKHTQAIFFLHLVPWASLRKQKHWHLRNGKGRGVSWIQHNDDNVPQGFSVVLSQDCKDSRQTRENIYLYLSGSWQASLKYVNVLMLFHWETTIWDSLDWWHVQMDWNYVQFVFFHSGSFESVYVTEGYLHILCGNAYCLCGWLDLSWLERLCYSVLVQCSESYHGRSFKGFYNVHSMDLMYAVKRVMQSVRDNKTAAQFLQLPKGRFCCSQSSFLCLIRKKSSSYLDILTCFSRILPLGENRSKRINLLKKWSFPVWA